MKRLFFLAIILLQYANVVAQQPTQTIRGTIIDENSSMPLPYVNVILQNTDPVIGATTNENGEFRLENVSIGRYNLQASFIGYETKIITELVVSSAKSPFVKIRMKESAVSLDAVAVRPTLDKEEPINKMATVSARMLSVEEAQRYAGGLDDPARLVSSFAGVSSGVNSNAIVVRGNSPKSLQWKMEGIEVPNPNHFADLQTFGGGAFTALSSQLLDNSDFFTGAFPAEYNNALSGVFDIFIRNGNNQDYEHTVQVGTLGIDVASEGPLKKGGNSSYIFNYRYSTLGLVSQISDSPEGIKYQDLSFKLNFPTKKAGVFSVWGIGLIDGIKEIPNEDSSQWYYEMNRSDYDANQYMAASGVAHKIFIGKKSQLKTTLASTVRGINWKVDMLDGSLNFQPYSRVEGTNLNYVLNSSINTKFSKKHTNKTGISLTGLQYNMLLENTYELGQPLTLITDETGFSSLLSAYSSSLIRINNKLTTNIGLNTQVFTLNSNYTIEPRLGIKYQINSLQQIGFAYGLHSRLERINTYFTKDALTGEFNNKDLDFTKSHHFILSYNINLSENMILKVEPYYQYLFDVPIVANTSYSLINLEDDWFVNDLFENTGKGRNYGLDITLEKYLTKGYYFMFSGSVFNSQYTGGDNVWRSTRYNKNYSFNILGGKEWNLGKDDQNILGLNLRFTYQGGNRYTPFKLDESIIAEDVIYDESKAFSEQIAPAFIGNFTANYKINREKTSHEIAFKIANFTNYGDFIGYRYNQINNTVDETREAIIVPSISYKIEFY